MKENEHIYSIVFSLDLLIEGGRDEKDKHTHRYMYYYVPELHMK